MADKATPMWVADMDLPIAPNIQRRLVKRASHLCGFGYTIQPPEAWDAVTRWIERHFKWKVEKSEIVFSASVVTSVANILRLFTNADDAVLLMTPLYQPIQAAVSGCGRRLVCHELQFTPGKYYEIGFNHLEEQIESEDVKLVILCNPHNPSGRVWTKSELQRLLDICTRRDVMIVSDEIWCDWVLSWSPRGHTPIASLANAGKRCITLMAPTKTWNLAGAHASYVIIQDEDLLRRYLQYVEPAHLNFGSAVATEALLATYGSENEQGKNEAEEWLEDAKAYVEENIKVTLNYFRQNIPQLKPIRPDATYLVWIDCSELGSDASSAHRRFLEDGNVLLSPGSEFGNHTANFVRMNVALPRSTVNEALGRIHDYVMSSSQ